MRRFGVGSILAAGILFHSGCAWGQSSSLDAVAQELKEAKDAHTQITQAALDNFFAQVDPAMASPDAAATLYQTAGGTLPDPSPVVTQNENETATEKEARLALDQGNLTRIGTALELQCGLLHFGALFVTKPDQAGLQDAWVTWLKRAAQIYPQLAMPAGGTDQPAPPDKHHKRNKQEDNSGAPPAPKPPPPPFYPTEVMGKTLKDTLITKYLAFNEWADKDQGLWNVRSIPKLYKMNVLEPLRTTPTQATLAAWDAYIAMANADERDNDRWNNVVLPPLRFDRACDDYSISPSTEKLEGLVNLIKASPTNPNADDWISRVTAFMADYRAKHGGAPAPSTAPVTTTAPSASGLTVTTEQQGDATIITTHSSTNAAPVAPH